MTWGKCTQSIRAFLFLLEIISKEEDIPKPSRNDIYESVIRRMVAQALEDQERNFSRDHAFDSDEQLIAYIREQAETLHYAPREKEIIGWKLIIERFGTWGQAIEKAGCVFLPAVRSVSFPEFRRKLRNKRKFTGRKKRRKRFVPSNGLRNKTKRKNKRRKYSSGVPPTSELYI